ncbi:MAG TPA: DUF6377 domain-containing protein [Cyclobacteriaceae bacterium]|nr:DUF6377 domain-containing protein [Cyclobacteriaceae bacterium]
MRVYLSIVLCFIGIGAFSMSNTDSLLNQLNVAIENRDTYLKEKLSRIEKLKLDAQQLKEADRFDLYLKIYDEYKSFIYDSAFRYANKLQEIAYKLHDPAKLGYTKIKLGFVLVSSGLFNEALDTLRTLKSKSLPESIRSEYYYLMARTCYDLCDFNRDDFYSVRYATRGHAYIDSALALTPKQSSSYLLMSGLKDVRQRDMVKAQADFESMIGNFKLTDADFAVAASTLSFIYFYTNNKEKSEDMLIMAAIADMRASTKETLATLNLADMLYKKGDIDGAYKYVKIAMEDANYYGARHRKVQVAAVYPIIEGKQLSLVESRRKILFFYSAIVTLLTLVTIAFAIIIYKQFKNLRAAKKIISEANDVLTDTNHQLVDANKIKEEYVWYYFTTTAEYIAKLDALKKTLDLKLMTKKLDDLRFAVDSINIKKERDDLYHNFDLVFLKLFPDFVTVFNSLFKEEDRIVLKEGQLLNTELRIFALVRMGIHDHEKIAKILDYSVTTIYTYKTRIRNKSKQPNDFDKQIMAIRAI